MNTMQLGGSCSMHASAPGAAWRGVGCAPRRALRSAPGHNPLLNQRTRCSADLSEASSQTHSRPQQKEPAEHSPLARRQILAAAAMLAVPLLPNLPAAAGVADRTSDRAGAEAPPSKLTGLSPQQLADRIRDDFVNKQYYVTGNVSSEIFADDCLFTDPTIKVTGWKFYSDAVKTLFDADQSRADLISLDVIDGDVILKWRLEGIIKPWPGHPAIKPYTGVTRYVQNSDGLIAKHLETWDTSIADVFISVFFKGFGAPPAPPVTN